MRLSSAGLGRLPNVTYGRATLDALPALDALSVAAATRDAAPVETCLREWRTTARALSDPLRRAILTAPGDDDYAEVDRPRRPGWVVRVAFDLEILWNKPGRQATVFAEITDATLQALPAILNPSRDGYDDTAEDIAGGHTAVEDLFEALSCTRSTQ
jgi:hypothetical protein